MFDCDGVLVDSEPVHDAATRGELEHRGIALANSFFDEHVGMRVADQMAVLAARHGFDPDDLYAGREQRFWTLVCTRFEEVPGSVDTVRRLHAAGMKIAVATSGTRRWIDYVIDRLGLGAETATISGEDVREPKPHPEAYRRATAALGVAARRCAVVEDSERGYRAAIEAGCIVVVLNRHGHEPHRFTDAVAVTTSMPHARDVLLKAATGGVD